MLLEVGIRVLHQFEAFGRSVGRSMPLLNTKKLERTS